MSQTGWAIRTVVILMLCLASLFACAGGKVKPDLWGICKAGCKEKGADAAAVVGLIEEGSQPNCLCREPQEPRGGI